MRYHLLLTIDVEDWFQVENFKQSIPFSSWPRCELRVEKNTHRILNLLDSHEGTRTTDHGHGEKPRATFFVLGWIAERLPHLVREIQARGHEVGSHGYFHRLCREEPVSALKRDLMDSKKLLENITGTPVYGYRAPSFSISDDVLKLIEDCGYLYDSSFNSFALNKRYGGVDFARNGKKGIASQMSNTFYELPISNLRLGKHVLPWGGGGYFRLIPLPLFKLGVQWILEKEKAYLLYLHSWELDPDQPKVNKASTLFKFRHYVNLDKTLHRLQSFIDTYKECRFVTCHQYLEINTPISGHPSI